MSSLVRLRWPSVRVRVAALSGVMVLGFGTIGVVFQALRGNGPRPASAIWPRPSRISTRPWRRSSTA